eukprot:UN09027
MKISIRGLPPPSIHVIYRGSTGYISSMALKKKVNNDTNHLFQTPV